MPKLAEFFRQMKAAPVRMSTDPGTEPHEDLIINEAPLTDKWIGRHGSAIPQTET